LQKKFTKDFLVSRFCVIFASTKNKRNMIHTDTHNNKFLEDFFDQLAEIFEDSSLFSSDDEVSTKDANTIEDTKEDDASTALLGKAFYDRAHPAVKQATMKEIAMKKLKLENEIFDAVLQYIKSGLQNDSYKITWHKADEDTKQSYGVKFDDTMMPEWCSFEAYLIDSIPSLILSNEARQEFLNKFDPSIYDDRWYDDDFMMRIEDWLTDKLSCEGIAKVWIGIDCEDDKHPLFTVNLAFKKD